MKRFGKVPVDRTHVSTVSMLAGLVGFGCFYGLFIAIFQWLFGWPASLWYALSLPLASVSAHYYLRELRKFAASLRAASVLFRAPFAVRRLLALRAQLIAEIEAERKRWTAAPVRSSRLNSRQAGLDGTG